MAKRFMFVCLGVLALAVTYHLGATTATSQPDPNEGVLAFSVDGGGFYILTDYGNIYSGWWDGSQDLHWTLMGSWPGGATATQPSTWGGIKAQFKD